MYRIRLLTVLALLLPVRASLAQSAGEVTCELTSDGQSSITVPPGNVDFLLSVHLNTNVGLSAVQFGLNGSAPENFAFAGGVTVGVPFTQGDYSFILPHPTPRDGVLLTTFPQFTFFRLEMGNYSADSFVGSLITFHLRSVAALADGSSYTFTLDNPNMAPLWIGVDENSGDTLNDFITMAPTGVFTLHVSSGDNPPSDGGGNPPDDGNGGSGGTDGSGSTGSDSGSGGTGGTDTGNTGTGDPGTTDPGTTDPGTTDPGTTDPGTTDPGTTDPGTTDPGTGGGSTGGTGSTGSGTGGSDTGNTDGQTDTGTSTGTDPGTTTGGGTGSTTGGDGGSTTGGSTGSTGGTGTDGSGSTGGSTGGTTGGSTGNGDTPGDDTTSGGTGNTGGTTGGSQTGTTGGQTGGTTGSSTGNGSTDTGTDTSNNPSTDGTGEQSPTSTPTEDPSPLATLGGILLAGLGSRLAVHVFAGGTIGLGGLSVASTVGHWFTKAAARPRFLPRPLWGLTGLFAFLWALGSLFHH